MSDPCLARDQVPLNDLNGLLPGSFSVFSQFLLSSSLLSRAALKLSQQEHIYTPLTTSVDKHSGAPICCSPSSPLDVLDVLSFLNLECKQG